MSEFISEDDFLNNFQSNRFNENSNDPYRTAIYKRRCMILALAHTSGSLDNATSCQIFEDQLKDYVKLVDNRTGINNYAKATLDLMSNTKNISKSWKSGLPTDISKIPNVWEPLQGDCVTSAAEGLCENSLPPSSVICQLIGPKRTEGVGKAQSSKAFKQTTLNDFKKPQEQTFDKRADKKGTINSHYNEGKGVGKHNLFGTKPGFYPSNIHEPKEHKNYNQTKVRTRLEVDDGEASVYNAKQGQRSWKNNNKRSLYSQYEDQNKDETIEKSGIYHQLPGGKGYYRNNKPLFARIYGNNNDNDDHNMEQEFQTHFKTAGHELKILNQKKFGNQSGIDRSDYNDGRTNRTGGSRAEYGGNYGANERSSGFQPQTIIRKSLGGKRSVTSKFVPPVRNNSQGDDYRPKEEMITDPEAELDERLKNIEPRMIELIKNEIMDTGAKIDWDDIAGLQFAKNTIQEIVVWPMLRPDIFTGLRRPPKGILLFGPPGTGKTLIGKCIASQSNSTFFSISASSLTSKWIGDGEKMVRALFAVARCHQPAVVFIDEIDSLLSQRSDTEHESSRRIKTEFLVQLDGAGTGEDDRILVIGATNRPQELDEAARRRLVKRLYIPLPDKEARKQLVGNLMKHERNELTGEDIEEISCLTDGYSGADMKNLCQEASLGPIRSISSKDMFQISAEQVRPVNVEDFKMALKRVKSSVSSRDLEIYLRWDEQYGSGAV